VTCPVCGFDRLPGPPEDYLICPSCGTEFGYDDFAESHEERQERWVELRHRWLNQGARWFSRATPPPVDWNPYSQLLSTGLVHDTVNDAIEDSVQFVLMGTESA
jgi:hypothetical protein